VSSLERRFGAGLDRPAPDFSRHPAYWFECSRVWLYDVLPILVKYKYRQIKRDQIALWTGIADDVIEGIYQWLDRHGF
jgi:hypothetical protein